MIHTEISTYLFCQILLLERPHQGYVILGNHRHFILHALTFACKLLEDTKLCHKGVSELLDLVFCSISWLTAQ